MDAGDRAVSRREEDSYASEGVTKLLIGNKCDMKEDRKVTYEEGEELSKSFNVPFLETSAKSIVNVEETFKTMSKEIRAKMDNRGNRSYSLYTSANGKDMKPGKSLQSEHEHKKSGR